jgi:hypothetical protein
VREVVVDGVGTHDPITVRGRCAAWQSEWTTRGCKFSLQVPHASGVGWRKRLALEDMRGLTEDGILAIRAKVYKRWLPS